jgi:hypothetical protein
MKKKRRLQLISLEIKRTQMFFPKAHIEEIIEEHRSEETTKAVEAEDLIVDAEEGIISEEVVEVSNKILHKLKLL